VRNPAEKRGLKEPILNLSRKKKAKRDGSWDKYVWKTGEKSMRGKDKGLWPVASKRTGEDVGGGIT